jgi:hypothetical protein
MNVQGHERLSVDKAVPEEIFHQHCLIGYILRRSLH